MMQILQVALPDLENAMKMKAIVKEAFVTVNGSVERESQRQGAGSCGKCSQCQCTKGERNVSTS
jgi:hypothetical protein